MMSFFSLRACCLTSDLRGTISFIDKAEKVDDSVRIKTKGPDAILPATLTNI